MSEPKRDDEPTMEEILASIRKIISEDDMDEVSDPIGAVDEAEPEPMELTQLVSEDGSVVDLRGEQRATLVPFHEDAADEPAEALRPKEGEARTVAPLVPEGTRVHAEMLEEEEAADLAEPEPDEVAADIESESVEAVAEPADPTEAEEAAAAAEPALDSLVSTEVAAAATAAISRLKDGLSAERAAGGGNAKTLEALVCEAMAPHLKAWLDENLAGVVERVVREEIEKLVKRA